MKPAVSLDEAEQRTFIAIGKLAESFNSKAVALAVLRPALALHAGVEGEKVTSALYCLMRTGLIEAVTIGDPASPRQLPGYRLTELGLQTYGTMNAMAFATSSDPSDRAENDQTMRLIEGGDHA